MGETLSLAGGSAEATCGVTSVYINMNFLAGTRVQPQEFYTGRRTWSFWGMLVAMMLTLGAILVLADGIADGYFVDGDSQQVADGPDQAPDFKLPKNKRGSAMKAELDFDGGNVHAHAEAEWMFDKQSDSWINVQDPWLISNIFGNVEEKKDHKQSNVDSQYKLQAKLEAHLSDMSDDDGGELAST